MNKDIDFSFRPESYWKQDDPIQAILAGIKGETRRRIALAKLEAGASGDLPEFMLAPLLEDSDRQFWGSIHPQMMGGEYLPADLPGETTIARVSLQSTTGDVMEVRARLSPAGISYRIVDEYETEFNLPFDESPLPLTVWEVVRMLDESQGMLDFATGLVLPYIAWQYGNGPSEHEDVAGWRRRACAFVRVSSQVYPGLGDWYAERIEIIVDGVLTASGSSPDSAGSEATQ